MLFDLKRTFANFIGKRNVKSYSNIQLSPLENIISSTKFYRRKKLSKNIILPTNITDKK